MPNCKPGDLAVVKGLVQHIEHNGRVVVAGQIIETDEDGICWAVEPATFAPNGGRELYNDRNLFPIRGTSTPTKQTLDTPIPATVL